MVKHTTRRFVLEVPVGIEKTTIRSYILDAHGIPHAVDNEIDMYKYDQKIVEFEGTNIFERDVLSKEPIGTKCISTEDIVTIIE